MRSPQALPRDPDDEPRALEAAPKESAPHTPDLLNRVPCITIDTDHLIKTVRSAFSAGDTDHALQRAMDAAPLCESVWSDASFGEGLFLESIVDQCMVVKLDGLRPTLSKAYLQRVMSRPPADPNVLSFRREILAELGASGEAHARFGRIYACLWRLRAIFESDEPFAELDSRSRRLDTFRALHTAVEAMSAAFEAAHSGLTRIDAFARFVRASPGYLRTVELLEHDAHLSTVTLSMRLGADGRVRQFEVLGLNENKTNHFYATPVGRWLSKLWLNLRGYRVNETVLLDRWFESVFEGVERFLPTMIQLMADMEFYLASLAFRDLCRAKGMEVSFPEFVDGPVRDSKLHADRLFNPLLFAQGVEVVTCDLSFQDEAGTTIVTGPNSGGKTRLLQALGMIQLLGQCGMFAPVAKARIERASGMFISLIEGAEADQREGRLGTELVRIRQLFEHSKPGVLVILDELCSGTDPSEGEEIFKLVLSLLGELRARVFVATHFLAFTRRLARDQGSLRLSFLQVEIDAALTPTHRFVPGVAGSSLARQTAARLGVTASDLRALVRRHTTPDTTDARADAKADANTGAGADASPNVTGDTDTNLSPDE